LLDTILIEFLNIITDRSRVSKLYIFLLVVWSLAKVDYPKIVNSRDRSRSWASRQISEEELE
jgi:hypothetical protein